MEEEHLFPGAKQERDISGAFSCCLVRFSGQNRREQTG